MNWTLRLSATTERRREVRSPKYMRIGAVTELTGVCANTIRRMEARGLVQPARDWNNGRRFTERDVATICAIVAQSPRKRLKARRA